MALELVNNLRAVTKDKPDWYNSVAEAERQPRARLSHEADKRPRYTIEQLLGIPLEEYSDILKQSPDSFDRYYRSCVISISITRRRKA